MFSPTAAAWLSTYGDYLIELRKYRNWQTPRMWRYVQDMAAFKYEMYQIHLRSL